MEGKITPAPWDLNGLGIMHFFWGPKRIDPFSGQEVSGIGGFIIARYDNSPVGPYNELLYIPGRHKVEGKSSFFISKIYVDSIDSVVSGQANWGIPKELADISIEKQGKNIEVKASFEGAPFFDASITHGRVSFPVTTKLIPIPLHQDWKGRYYFTQFVGSGSGSFSKVLLSSVDDERFPDTRDFQSLATIVVDPFKLSFPLAKIKQQDLTIS
jgi:hypothetical protein